MCPLQPVFALPPLFPPHSQLDVCQLMLVSVVGTYSLASLQLTLLPLAPFSCALALPSTNFINTLMTQVTEEMSNQGGEGMSAYHALPP